MMMAVPSAEAWSASLGSAACPHAAGQCYHAAVGETLGMAQHLELAAVPCVRRRVLRTEYLCTEYRCPPQIQCCGS